VKLVAHEEEDTSPSSASSCDTCFLEDIVLWRLALSYEEEDTCMSYEEEDTCMSYEEEDTCFLEDIVL
jgi:hypothetical protein